MFKSIESMLAQASSEGCTLPAVVQSAEAEESGRSLAEIRNRVRRVALACSATA